MENYTGYCFVYEIILCYPYQSLFRCESINHQHRAWQSDMRGEEDTARQGLSFFTINVISYDMCILIMAWVILLLWKITHQASFHLSTWFFYYKIHNHIALSEVSLNIHISAYDCGPPHFIKFFLCVLFC